MYKYIHNVYLHSRIILCPPFRSLEFSLNNRDLSRAININQIIISNGYVVFYYLDEVQYI